MTMTEAFEIAAATLSMTGVRGDVWMHSSSSGEAERRVQRELQRRGLTALNGLEWWQPSLEMSDTPLRPDADVVVRCVGDDVCGWWSPGAELIVGDLAEQDGRVTGTFWLWAVDGMLEVVVRAGCDVEQVADAVVAVQAGEVSRTDRWWFLDDEQMERLQRLGGDDPATRATLVDWFSATLFEPSGGLTATLVAGLVAAANRWRGMPVQLRYDVVRTVLHTLERGGERRLELASTLTSFDDPEVHPLPARRVRLPRDIPAPRQQVLCDPTEPVPLVTAFGRAVPPPLPGWSGSAALPDMAMWRLEHDAIEELVVAGVDVDLVAASSLTDDRRSRPDGAVVVAGIEQGTDPVDALQLLTGPIQAGEHLLVGKGIAARSGAPDLVVVSSRGRSDEQIRTAAGFLLSGDMGELPRADGPQGRWGRVLDRHPVLLPLVHEAARLNMVADRPLWSLGHAQLQILDELRDAWQAATIEDKYDLVRVLLHAARLEPHDRFTMARLLTGLDAEPPHGTDADVVEPSRSSSHQAGAVDQP